MRHLLAALALAASLSAVAPHAAASCFCRLPDAPPIPDGNSADNSEMKYAKHQMDDYQQQIDSYKQCLNQCVAEADQAAGKVIDKWNQAVQNYNGKQASP
ncbi:MAG: hypothetical protein R3292_09010 [Alcanivorax sp.]|nr:hypothetical protein [Alcanivorax sp.]